MPEAIALSVGGTTREERRDEVRDLGDVHLPVAVHFHHYIGPVLESSPNAGLERTADSLVPLVA